MTRSCLVFLGSCHLQHRECQNQMSGVSFWNMKNTCLQTYLALYLLDFFCSNDEAGELWPQWNLSERAVPHTLFVDCGRVG